MPSKSTAGWRRPCWIWSHDFARSLAIASFSGCERRFNRDGRNLWRTWRDLRAARQKSTTNGIERIEETLVVRRLLVNASIGEMDAFYTKGVRVCRPLYSPSRKQIPRVLQSQRLNVQLLGIIIGALSRLSM